MLILHFGPGHTADELQRADQQLLVSHVLRIAAVRDVTGSSAFCVCAWNGYPVFSRDNGRRPERAVPKNRGAFSSCGADWSFLSLVWNLPWTCDRAYTSQLLLHCLKASYCPGRVAPLVGASCPTPKGHGFDSSQGTYLGCRLDPWLGHVQEAAGRCFSLTWMPLSLPLPVSLKSIKRIFGWGLKNKQTNK